MGGFTTRLKHAWNAFTRQTPNEELSYTQGEVTTYGSRPERTRFRMSNERSIISSIYTRIAIDVATVGIRHVRLDDENRYESDIDSGLNNCLTLEANLDQAAQHLRLDLVKTLLDEGVCAVVPVDTTVDPRISSSYDIKTLRVGTIVAWKPRHVTVSLYNEKTGKREEITLEKRFVAIIENPLYEVMNEPNSTLRRLIHKLNLLDAVDEQSSSGKLDLIIQLPYVIKSEARRDQAEKRRADIEFQLKGSQYGIAYTDATEKITQLNRPTENNLLKQVEYLTALLYNQLGLTEEVMNGTADDKTMLNYMNRTVKPILNAIVEAMRRAFLTKTARAQGQTIQYFVDAFSLVPVGDMAEIADKFTRNEILTSNEIRQIMGFKPSTDPKADKLINSNMPQQSSGAPPEASPSGSSAEQDTIMNDLFDGLNSDIDAILQNANANGG